MVLVTSDGRCEKELRTRIRKAKTQVNKLKKFLINTKIKLRQGCKYQMLCLACSALWAGDMGGHCGFEVKGF